MLVVCYGVTKSGSTLAFELARKALHSVGHLQEELPEGLVEPNGSGINFINGPLTPHRILALLEHIGDGRILAVKTHAALRGPTYRLVDDLCKHGLAKVQVVYRDPRDVCLSLLDAGMRARAEGTIEFSEFVALPDAIASLKSQMENLRAWGSVTDALILSYHEVGFVPSRALTKIESHLGITCEHDPVIEEVMTRTFTQKNKAVKDRYKHELNDTDREMIEDVFFEFIERVCESEDYSWFKTART